MIKGSRKITECRNLDFNPCIPDNPEPPLCKIGYGFSSDCLKGNNKCTDYKYGWAITYEEMLRRLEIKNKEGEN